MLKKIIAAAILVFSFPAVSSAFTYGADFLSGTCTGFDNNTSCTLAYDDNIATRYDTIYNGTLPFGLVIDLGTSTAKTISKIGVNRYRYTGGGGEYFVKTINILGSNDNSNFTQIGSFVVNNTDPDEYKWYYAELATSTGQTAYRYVKFSMPDTWGSGNQIYINEFEAYECTDCGTGATTSTPAWTEICTETATGTACYRPLDVYNSYLIDILFVVVPLLAILLIFRRKRKKAELTYFKIQ